MPTVLHRPEVVETRPPELREPPPLRPVRSRRWLRWMGWLLAAGAVALIIYLVFDATRDDGSAELTDRVTPPAVVSGITSDPKPRTPVVAVTPGPDVEPRLGFEKEATATPLDPSRSMIPDVEPRLGFEKEATVTPVNR